MPIFEFVCPNHGTFERLALATAKTARCNQPVLGPGNELPMQPCNLEGERVEFSVPAKRNPEYGIQK